MAVQIIILAAGQSKRMRSKLSKVLHPLCGQRVIDYVLQLAAQLDASRTILITNPESATAPWPAGIQVVVQDPPRGTGDAVQKAVPFLNDCDDVIVLFGDTPLISLHTLHKLQTPDTKAITVLGMRPPQPAGYGRLHLDENGCVQAIIEDKDLDDEQKSLNLCNSGVMKIQRHILDAYLPLLQPNNAQGEYYLTDLVKISRAAGFECGVVEGEFEEFIGINTRADLADAASILQKRWRKEFMRTGVSLVDPQTVYFSADTHIAQDVTVHPHVHFGPRVQIDEDAVIYPFCSLNHTHVGKGCSVGPFAHTRGGVVMDPKAEVGNFVELKKTHLHKGAKAKHLSYLGDATVGEKANVGAGTITCNYDGYNKFETVIGDHAFVGTNCSLIAPLHIGAGALIGAGSVISQDVQENDLAISRAPQQVIQGGAENFRQKRTRGKVTV